MFIRKSSLIIEHNWALILKLAYLSKCYWLRIVCYTAFYMYIVRAGKVKVAGIEILATGIVKIYELVYIPKFV